jgi:hypothetical protein
LSTLAHCPESLRKSCLHPSMPLSKAEQKSRRILAKSVAAELRSRAKAAGWRVSQGLLFREEAGWFVDARPNVWVTEQKWTLDLFAKPMSIDPVFWEIVATKDNNQQPLSFRLFGAWTVSTPPISQLEVAENSLDAASLADTIVQVAQREFEHWKLGRSFDGFLSNVQKQGADNPYLPAVVCALALLDRREDARQVCIAARERSQTGGFLVGSRTFFDLALEWLDKTEPTRH